jgi:hypothetical protein
VKLRNALPPFQGGTPLLNQYLGLKPQAESYSPFGTDSYGVHFPAISCQATIIPSLRDKELTVSAKSAPNHPSLFEDEGDEDDYERYQNRKGEQAFAFLPGAAWPEKDRAAAILPTSTA